MTAVKRIAFTLLAIVVIAAACATRQTVTATARDHVARGCQAAAPGGKAATIDADVAIAVQHAASTPGISTRPGEVLVLAVPARPARPVFEFARPHDPQHLHPFSLLI